MKIKFCITAFLLIISSLSFSQSLINYQAGTVIDVQTGASVCADSVILAGTLTGVGTVCGLTYSLNLAAIIEGFYDAMTDTMVSDTATVYLRSSVSPYAIIDSDKQVLSPTGTATFSFANAINGVNYYIVVSQRNTIEVWSYNTPFFTGGTLTYNFTDLASKAFGDNMKQVDVTPAVFALFSGDVNQDGTIDASDVSDTDNDANNSLSGYVNTDVTGDNFVDAADVSVVDNNAYNSVSVVAP